MVFAISEEFILKNHGVVDANCSSETFSWKYSHSTILFCFDMIFSWKNLKSRKEYLHCPRKNKLPWKNSNYTKKCQYYLDIFQAKLKICEIWFFDFTCDSVLNPALLLTKLQYLGFHNLMPVLICEFKFLLCTAEA